MLQASLFGSFSLSVGGRPVAGFPAGKSRELFCMLALAGGWQSRTALGARLWDDCDEATARKRLRICLWRIRRSLADLAVDPLFATTDSLVLRLDEVWTDVGAFERRLRRGDRESLAEAVELYCGDLLQDSYAEWCLDPRQALRQHYLHALRSLMQGARERQQWVEAIRWGRQLLQHEEYREDVHRELMRSFMALGDRAAALRQFEVCRDLLRRELGVEPMPETIGVYREIHNGGPAPERALLSSPSTPELHLLGEQVRAELGDIAALLDQLRTRLSSVAQQLAPPRQDD